MRAEAKNSMHIQLNKIWVAYRTKATESLRKINVLLDLHVMDVRCYGMKGRSKEGPGEMQEGRTGGEHKVKSAHRAPSAGHATTEL